MAGAGHERGRHDERMVLDLQPGCVELHEQPRSENGPQQEREPPALPVPFVVSLVQLHNRPFALYVAMNGEALQFELFRRLV